MNETAPGKFETLEGESHRVQPKAFDAVSFKQSLGICKQWLRKSEDTTIWELLGRGVKKQTTVSFVVFCSGNPVYIKIS